jgi:NADP-dependent 3-hydroxy acid dehydrogenase YdfG
LKIESNIGSSVRLAVITGGGSGIGRAIAVDLAKLGMDLCLVGRRSAALAETAVKAAQFSKATTFECDLKNRADYQELLAYLGSVGRLDVLVHSAGIIHRNSLEQADIEDFDLQYATNVRAPYLLTQCVLPFLTAGSGQVVFVNSSAGLSARRPEIAQYAATKHALKAVADSLREELNPKGIRVLTIYLGRTATPMQQMLHGREGATYRPELLMQPEDVAVMVTSALGLPRTAEVTDISIRPMQKSY